MKEIKCILKKSVWLFAVASAVFFAGCQDEDDQQNSNNNNDSTTDYPATADVIHNAVTDIDGNTYDAVRIGDQIWMASNLRTTREPNGEEIPENDNDWEPCRFFPNNDPSNVPTYGYLYNWYAVMHDESASNTNPSGVQGICPNGWHVPSDAEWIQLTSFVGSQSEYCCDGTSSNIAKSLAATTGWLESPYLSCSICFNLSSNNATGFSAVGAGWDGGVGFNAITGLWSSTPYSLEDNTSSIYIRKLDGLESFVTRTTSFGRTDGWSVRCLKD